jgi:hypothetical protein
VEWVHSAYGENIPFRGTTTVPFRNRTQELALGRNGSVPFHLVLEPNTP